MRLDIMENEIRMGVAPEPCAALFACGIEAQPRVVLVRAEAETLAQGLAEGSIDCALIPPLAAFRIPFCRLVPGQGVCAELKTQSERLIAREPQRSLTRLQVAPSARAMIDWARLLLAEESGFLMEWGEYEGGPSDDLPSGTGLLLGGAEGLGYSGTESSAHDLGTMWRESTGLPAVLRVWACRFRAPYPGIRACLWRARQHGEDHFDACVKQSAETFGIPDALLRDYLAQTLSYSVGSLEADSLRHLVAMAHRHGLFPEPPGLQFC